MLFGLQTSFAEDQTNPSSLSKFIYREPPVARFEPLEEKQFSLMELEMQYMIYRNGDHTITNHFCVVGYQFKSGRKEAVVIWTEPNWLIQWTGGKPD